MVAGARLIDCGQLRRQHDLVDILLRRTEFAVDRKSAGNVRSVAVEFAAGIDQQQLAVVEARVVFHVMQHAGIGAAGNDAGVRRKTAAMAIELVQQLGLDLVFEHPRAGETHRPRMCIARHDSSAAHRRQLVFVLEQTHFVDQHAQVDDFLRRLHAGAGAAAHLVQPADHACIPGWVGAEIGEQARLVFQHLRQQIVELVDTAGLVETELFARRLRTVTEAVPDFALDILVAAEQHAAPLLTGELHQHRLRLGKAGQVMKRAVVTVRKMGIGIACQLRRGRQYRHTGFHHSGQTGAAGNLQG